MYGKLILIVLITAFAGCQTEKKQPPTPSPPVVTVITPVPTEVQNYYDYNGMLDAVETVQIQARVEGFLDKMSYKEGDEVKVGDPLYIIDPREFNSAVSRSRSDIARAKADVENAKAQILLAESELSRLTSSGGSKSELDKATAQLAANKAMLDVATANRGSAEAAERTALLKLSYTDIKAPIAGRISRTLVTPGNLVGQKDATLLTTIVSVDPVHVYFDVPEKELVAYQRLLTREGVERTATIPVEVGVGAEEGFPHRGTLDFQENRVESGSGTVRIRGILPNPIVPPRNVRLLYPGLYCRVRVPAGSPQKRLAIPEDTLMTGQEGRFVFVIGADNVVQKRTVTVGQQVWRMNTMNKDSTMSWTLTNPSPAADSKVPTTAPVRTVVAIENGLEPGDRIVAVGLLRARPGQAVTPELWDFKAPLSTAKKEPQ